MILQKKMWIKYCGTKDSKLTIVKGKIINVEKEMVYLKHNDKIVDVKLKDNTFETSINIDKPQYLYLSFSRNSFENNYPMYIFPGHSMYIEFERLNAGDKITVSGSNKMYSDYFNQSKFSFDKSDNNADLSIPDFNHLSYMIDSMYNNNIDKLNELKSSLSNIDENFSYYEPLRLFFLNLLTR